MAHLQFWFDFASTYSYLAAMRIDALAAAEGVHVTYHPFLLGPTFAAQGLNTSPFNAYPTKGKYMWRDMEREAASLGLPCRRPDPFPQNSLLPARIALYGLQHAGWGPAFAKAVFFAQFGLGRSISDPDTIATLLLDLALDPATIVAAAQADENKARLRAQCDEARERGIFGAPTFITPDGEMFWGNDRLERALSWAARAGTAA